MTVEQITVHNLSKRKPSAQRAPKRMGRMMDFAPQSAARAHKQKAKRVQPRSIPIQSAAPQAPKENSKSVTSAQQAKPVAPVVPVAPIAAAVAARARVSAHEGLMATARPRTEAKPTRVARPANAASDEPKVVRPRIAPIVPQGYYDTNPASAASATPSAQAVAATAATAAAAAAATKQARLDSEAELESMLASQAKENPKPAPIGDYSPFLSSVVVEKRPLYSDVAEPEPYVPTQENVYDEPQTAAEQPKSKQRATRKRKTKKRKQSFQLKHHQTEVVPQVKNKKLSGAMIALIVGTVLIGVALGVLLYFAIFNHS